jgi:hypothetical protein
MHMTVLQFFSIKNEGPLRRSCSVNVSERILVSSKPDETVIGDSEKLSNTTVPLNKK